MNDPIDFRDIHKLWMALSTDTTPVSTRSSSIDPQANCGQVDPMYRRQFASLSTLYHPAIAAVLAHENLADTHHWPLTVLERVA